MLTQLYAALLQVSGGGGGGQVDTVVAGAGIAVDSTDVSNPIVSSDLNDPDVAYIRTSGSDVTGTIGKFQLPYATLQGALDDGAVNIDAGDGFFGNGVFPAPGTYCIRGRGTTTTFGTLTFAAGTTQLRDVGQMSFMTGDVTVPADSSLIVVGATIIGNVSLSAGGADNAASLSCGGPGVIVGNVNGTAVDGSGAAVTVQTGFVIIGDVNVDISGAGAAGSINVFSAGNISGTLTPNAATVAGAVISGVWFDNVFP